MAFFPALYKYAEEKHTPLIENQNFVEYHACDDSNESKLFAILAHENKNTNEIKAKVNLPHSIRQFYKRHKTSKTTFDKTLGRNLTNEEAFMRDYFQAILTDNYYELELYNEALKIK